VRRHAAIEVDLQRRQRQDGTLGVGVGRPFERGVEEPRVGGHLLDVAICRDDEQGGTGRLARAGHGGERLRRRREPGSGSDQTVEPGLGSGAAQQGAKSK
jgi:hypothetical protein